VVLLEGARRPGAKILVSGGSRCNVTNRIVTDADFWGGRRTIVRRVLGGFSADRTIAFFRDIGVPLKEEADGKLFPESNRARDVLDALLRETAASGARLHAGRRALAVERTAAGFLVETTSGPIASRSVVIATGGRSLPRSGSDGAGYGFAERLGHTIVPTTPGLVPLTLDDPTGMHRALSGVSQPAELTVWVDGRAAIRLRGSLLWTHFGISGPVALNASRHWLRAASEGRAAAITASFLPGQSFEAVDRRLVAAARGRARASLETTLTTGERGGAALPASAAAGLLERIGVDGAQPIAHLSRDARRRLSHALVEWPLPVVGSRGYNVAEVTAGGVDLRQIDPATLESRVCPGLYLVGEVLDVDGRIGGFNFQWAWSSARAAARGLSR
jgi:predicted Rossmann fold flavoprotein